MRGSSCWVFDERGALDLFSWRGLGDRDRAVSRKRIFGQVSLSQEGNARAFGEQQANSSA